MTSKKVYLSLSFKDGLESKSGGSKSFDFETDRVEWAVRLAKRMTN